MPRELTTTRKIFVDRKPLSERAIWAIPVAAIVLLATLWPLSWSPRDDDFPLSTYPMFSGPPVDTVAIPHVVAIGSDGQRRIVSRSELGAGEVMQAFESLRLVVRAGPAAAMELCREVASRVTDGDEEVRVVTDIFDPIRYFSVDEEPLDVTVHASCDVEQEP